jgi:hypothetical protein
MLGMSGGQATGTVASDRPPSSKEELFALINAQAGRVVASDEREAEWRSNLQKHS